LIVGPDRIPRRVPDDHWQAVVKDWMDRARLVVLALSDAAFETDGRISAGLAWEVETALDRAPPEDLLFIFESVSAWRRFRAGPHRRLFGSSEGLPDDVHYLAFDPDGSPRVLRNHGYGRGMDFVGHPPALKRFLKDHAQRGPFHWAFWK
jgi:hypothetical protein